MSRENTTYCLRIGWNSPELSERLTMLVIVGTSIDAHCFRRQVGIGSESDCLLGQPRRIFKISASEADSKVEKSGGDVD